MSRNIRGAERNRRRGADARVHWLRAGAVAVGLGAAIASGQGVATATPSDAPDPGPANTAGKASGAENGAVDTGSDVEGESPGGSAREPGSSRSALPGPAPSVAGGQKADAEIDSDPVVVKRAEAGLEDTVDLADEQPGITRRSGDARGADEIDPLGVSVPDEEPTPLRLRDRVHTARADLSGAVSLADAATDLRGPAVSVVSAVRSLAAVATTPSTPEPEAATEVTFTGIVTDVLRWLGLGSLAKSDLPVPDAPVPWLVESLWLAVRQNLGKSSGPPRGAQPAAPTATTAVARPHPVALAGLAPPGVDVHLGADGTVDVIDGAFTDTVVRSGSDAAQLLNALAPLLGASAGFAGTDNITVAHAGAETFYRLSDSVNGVPVVGSEVILVTDADGTVTGLFNNHNRHLDGIDVTPDARIDDPREVIRVAGAALADSAAGPGWAVRALSAFDRELVLYAADENTTPQLAWAVTANPFNPRRLLGVADAPTSGSVYLIDAAGADAGTVVMHTATAPADIPFTRPETVTATDVRGVMRSFTVSRLNLLLFNLDILSDPERRITTFRTPFIGLIPGIPVFGPIEGMPLGPWTWDRSAVAAHANMAEVYDYYLGVLGRDSYDGKGSRIKVITEFNPTFGLFGSYGNAFWDPFHRQLVFGDGADREGALDVVGHELTHGVFGEVVMNGNPVVQLLNYKGESGSVSEAYSDIMGGFIEGKDPLTDPGRWTEGEDTFNGANRDMKDPLSLGGREHYDQRYTGDDDRGGVHVNSTILSHATYLMMMEYAGVTDDITQDEWAHVFYNAMFRLSPGATFTDVRAAIISSANAAGFDADELNAVADAFDQVGIA